VEIIPLFKMKKPISNMYAFHVDVDTFWMVRWTVFLDGNGYPTKEIDKSLRALAP
jgi:hypothetical protein